MIRTWHFVGSALRNGRPIPADGVWLTHAGALMMCESGLHASPTPFDALQYSPGATLCLVDCDGETKRDTDKLVCTRRRIVARMDATELLRYFARMQALSVVHLWDAPDIMLDYLMTGEESMRTAARAAAGAAARAAARAAAGDAAWAAAWAAAWDAAWAAARAAAGAAARAAAWAAAWDAAWAAAWDAARAAARNEFNALIYECFGDWL